MTLPSNVLTKLDSPQWQEHIIELQAAPTLSEMVYRGLQMGLLLARWLLEGELERRAQGPIVWSTCPRCGHRLNSKGWQSRQLQTLIGGLV